MSKPRLDNFDKRLVIVQGQLDALCERENELQILVRSVRLERLALKAEHNDLEALRVPINWLPTELLCRIFVLSTDPFDDLDDTSCDATPITLSHVCRKWRGIALGTPMLWRRVQLHPRDASYDEPGPQRVRSPQALAFLRRAQPVPLDIILKAEPDPILLHLSGHIQLMIQRRSDAFRFGYPSRTLHVLETLGDIRSILVDDWFTMTLDVFLLLCMREPVFPSLETLSLRIFDLNFYRPFLDYITSCRETPSFVKWKPQPFRKLQCLSLFGIPFDFLPTCDLPLLREFTFGHPLDCLYNPSFKIAHFARFLSSAPNLEKLSLLQAGPEFDIGIDTSLPPTFWDKAIDWYPAGPNKVPPLVLANLKELEWIGPPVECLYYFFTFFPSLALESLNVAFLPPSFRIRTQPTILHSPFTSLDTLLKNSTAIHSTKPLFVPTIILPTLKTLCVDCSTGDTLRHPFRRIDVPALETLSISNTEANHRKKLDDDFAVYEGPAWVACHASKTFAYTLPYLPRLESIFRDPRLPFLTSFSLASFAIVPDSVETLLAYMPALRVMHMDMVDGVDDVLKGLAMTRVSKDGKRMVLKSCLRLEEMRFWGCDNGFHMECLEKVVRLRSGMVKDTKEMKVSAAPKSSSKAGEINASGVGVRKIKPLKRGAAGTGGGWCGVEGPAAREGEEATRMKKVKIRNCQSVTEERAREMERWGVMVEWAE